MTMTDEARSARVDALVGDLIERYAALVEESVEQRWNAIDLDLYEVEAFQVVGGLLARQATLTIQLARSPGIWNGHIAPLVLRSMVDAHIALAWILKDKVARAKQYILYGLGQEKLYIEHLKKGLPLSQDGGPMADLVRAKEAWLNSQRRDFLTEVNVGSWSGANTRDMAKDADCEALYNYAYMPFSGAVHSMWQHVSTYSLKSCQNPLHKYHLVPCVNAEVGVDGDYVFRSAKYFSRSCEVIDQHFGLGLDLPVMEEWFDEELRRVVSQMEQEFPDPSE